MEKKNSDLIDIGEAMESCNLIGTGDMWTSEQLSGGLTNDNVSVTILRESQRMKSKSHSPDFVIRRFRMKTSSSLHYDRKQECSNTSIAAGIRVAPKVQGYVAPNSKLGHGGAIILDYLSGATLDVMTIKNLCSTTEGASQLAKTLVNLHTGAEFTNQFDPITSRESYVSECVKLRGVLQDTAQGSIMWAGFDDVVQLLQPIQKKLQSIQEPLVACHNDLLAANIMEPTNKQDAAYSVFVLIDFELSGAAPASWELGNIISENGLDSDTRAIRHLVEQYWKHRSNLIDEQDEQWINARIARATAWSLVSKLTWAAWGRVMHLISSPMDGERFDFEEWSLERLHRARKILVDEEYKIALISSLR